MGLLPDSPYGITKGLGKQGTSATLSSNVVQWAAQLGLSWFRLQINMREVWLNQSDAPSNWAWTPLDDGFSKLQQAGFRISFPIRNLPAFCLTTPSQQASRSQDGTGNWFQADPTLYAQVAQAVAQRYNGVSDCVSNGVNYGKIRIQAIEIGNEEFNLFYSNPNFSGAAKIYGIHNSPYSVYNGLNGVTPTAQPTRDPHFWVPVAKLAYPAIKNVDKNFQVGMCAIWWKDTDNYTDFMTGLYAEGGGPYFDYANWHIYTSQLDPITGSSGPPTPNFQDGWQKIYALMKANGDANKFIWCTEFGWGIPSDCDTATQATRYKEVLDNARNSGVVQKTFLYTIHDRKPTDPFFDDKTLVYYGYGQNPATGYVFLPAYTEVQNYITQYPTWANTGSGSGTGSGPGPGSTTPHVCIIVMENRAYSEVINKTNWPNVFQMSQTYGLASNYFAVYHPSLPNYLALVSGSRQGVADDNPPIQHTPFTGDTIADALLKANVSVKLYFEGLPSSNPFADSSGYAVRHNPFVYFANFVQKNQLALSNFTYSQATPTKSNFIADLSSSTPPSFVWLTPNLIDDGHNGTDALADTFLGSLIPAIQATPWYTKGNGIIIVVFDEAVPDATQTKGIGDANPGGGQVVCLVVSEASKGAQLTTATNHYGLLRALCDLYGITQLGDAAHSANGDITPLFNLGAGPRNFSLPVHTTFQINDVVHSPVHTLIGCARESFRIILALETDPASQFVLKMLPHPNPAQITLPGVDGVISMPGVDGVLSLPGVDGVIYMPGIDGTITLGGVG